MDVAREGRVAVITMNRPPVNALSIAQAGRLAKTLLDLYAEPEIRAIVLTGAGAKAFCAGGDIEEFSRLDRTAMMNAVRTGQRLLWDLEHGVKPTIAAVNGACLGAGMGLAMSCDLRVASSSAVFGHPETSLGLTLAYASSVRLSRLVGLSRAKEMMLTARRVAAKEALDWGLLNDIVPPEEVLARSLAVARDIAANSPVAVQAAKKALTESLEKHYPNMIVAESRYLAQVLESPEVGEGLKAFLEKRPPRWKD
jgi:enoyl-CoA hydratase/carnithine racemase